MRRRTKHNDRRIRFPSNRWLHRLLEHVVVGYAALVRWNFGTADDMFFDFAEGCRVAISLVRNGEDEVQTDNDAQHQDDITHRGHHLEG